MTSARAGEGSAGLWRLSAIVLVGLCARVLAVMSFTGAIDPEGSEYARIAENLTAGHGYVGIATPGTQLIFPPLFPFMIAAGSQVTGQAELAGRLISVLMGTLLVAVVFFIALNLYDRTTAYVAAWLIAIHPYLIGFSSTVYVEATYMTLALAGVYWSLRALRGFARAAFVLAGLFFGLAYLTRPEAALYPLLALIVTWTHVFLTDRGAFRRVVWRSLWQPAVFLVLAAPYVLWLHGQTGQWRLEAKTPQNYAASLEVLRGAEVEEAEFGVDSDLTERGVRIVSNLSVLQAADFDARDLVNYLRGKAKHVVKYHLEVMKFTGFGSPPLLFFAMYGLFRRPWRRELAAKQILLLSVLGVSSAALFFAYFLTDRFLLIFVPILVVWAARGIVELAHWVVSTLRLRRGGVSRSARIELGLVLSLAMVIPLVAVPGMFHLQRQGRLGLPLRTAGEWLKAHAPGPRTVMDGPTLLAFHAGATFVPLPYSDSDVAIRYLDKRKVNFLVLSDYGRETSPRPYLQAWMDHGVPSARARLIYDVHQDGAGRVRIYEWDPAGRSEKEKPDAHR
jgi:4-amino-4-deoxy-L-arabinose transferase-like glycosyltransferase